MLKPSEKEKRVSKKPRRFGRTSPDAKADKKNATRNPRDKRHAGDSMGDPAYFQKKTAKMLAAQSSRHNNTPKVARDKKEPQCPRDNKKPKFARGKKKPKFARDNNKVTVPKQSPCKDDELEDKLRFVDGDTFSIITGYVELLYGYDTTFLSLKVISFDLHSGSET